MLLSFLRFFIQRQRLCCLFSCYIFLLFSALSCSLFSFLVFPFFLLLFLYFLCFLCSSEENWVKRNKRTNGEKTKGKGEENQVFFIGFSFLLTFFSYFILIFVVLSCFSLLFFLFSHFFSSSELFYLKCNNFMKKIQTQKIL